MARPVLIKIGVDSQQAIAGLDNVSRAFSRFGSQMRSIVSSASQTFTGIRQVAQGVQNLGFVLSAMVGYPLARTLQGWAGDAIDFERAMVEVQKTTGLSDKIIASFSERIRQLSLLTPTSAVELANLAAEAGRAGIGLGNILAGNIDAAIEEIYQFVRVVDMMSISTDLTGEIAAKAFGKFITIFKDIDSTNIEKLGSAINELGQASSIAEGEIVSGMLRIAPAATTLGWAAQDVAAFSTAIVQMSESASRGSTRVRAAIEQMVLNWEEAAKLLGTSASELKERLNTDAVGVLLEIIEVLGNVKDGVLRMKVATELFGTTGGNAIMRYANSFGDLERFIGISNAAFEDGTSLQNEFNRALGATKEQLKVLKNNILEVGKVFMADLLPVFKEVIGALIAGIQELGGWVEILTTKQKLLIIAVAGLLVVGLPLFALLGSIGFAFAMVLNGIVNFIGGLVSLVATIVSLSTGAIVLKTAFMGIASVVGGILFVAVAKATGVFDKILDKLNELAIKAKTWGGNFVSEIAGGIVSAAATTLVRALEFVGDIISRFLAPGSPPQEGPLSTIDRWGSALITTFLKGFKDADFSILRDIASTIGRVLQNLVSIGKLAEAKLGPALAKARELIAEIIYAFNQTGQIATDVLGKLTDMLGEAGVEIAKLLELQLRYNKALAELEGIENKKTDIQEVYSAEVRAIQNRTDLTAAEKADLIRQARDRRDLALENAATEESVAKKNVDSIKEQLDWQKQYIDALLDQDDVWKEHAETLKRVADAMEKVAKAITDALAGLLEQLRVNLLMQDLYKSKDIDPKPLLQEELSLRKRIVAEILGLENPTKEQLALVEENLARIKELEGILDAMSGKAAKWEMPTLGPGEGAGIPEIDLATLSGEVKKFSDTLKEGKKNWEIFKGAILGTFKLPDPKEFRDLGIGEEGGLTETQMRFYEWGTAIRTILDKIKEKWEELSTSWSGFVDKIKTKIDILKIAIEGLLGKSSGAEGESAILTMKENMAGLGAEEGNLSETGSAFSKLMDAIGGGGGLALPILLGLVSGFKLFSGLFGSIAKWAGASSILGTVTGALEGLGGALSWVLGGAGDISGGALLGIFAVLGIAIAYIVTHWEDFKEKLLSAWENIKEGIGGFVSEFTSALGIGKGEGQGFGDMLKGIWEAAQPLAKFLAEVLVGAIQVVGWIIKIVAPIIGRVLGAAIKGLIGVITGVLTVIGGIIEFVRALIGFLTGKNGPEKIKEALGKIVEGIKKIAGSFLETLSTIFGPILEFLGGLAVKIWEWVKTKAIPAIAGFVVGVYNYLKTNLPLWLAAIWQWLGNIVKSIWVWVTEKGIPALVDFVLGVRDRLVALLPEWLVALINWLSQMAVALWNFAKDKGIPALINFIKLGYDTLVALLPDWLVAVLTWLGNLAAGIWTWIVETGIPAIAGFVMGVVTYLHENLPLWVAKVLEWLGIIAAGILTWVTTKAIPKIKTFISEGITVLADIGTKWFDKVKDGLKTIYDEFVDIFTKIKDAIKEKIKEGINGMLDLIERGINKAIDTINYLIEQINKVIAIIPGAPLIGLLKHVNLPRLKEGGIALKPILSIIGDVSGGEAVLPLNKISSIIGDITTTQGRATAPIYVTIENPIVRSDDDLRQIINAVSSELGKKLRVKYELGTRAFGY